MDDRIRFETKEESNARRVKEFFEMTPSQRFEWFLRSFPEPDPNAPERPTENFVIRKSAMMFGEEVGGFLRAAETHHLKYLMVGGGAVNFHGYQRHSADIDLWIDPTPETFDKLISVLRSLGYTIDRLPEEVLRQEQNISIKISPDLDLELITRFNPGRTFEEAWEGRVYGELSGMPIARYHVLNYEDLIESKIRSARPKDLLDIQELQRKRK